MEKIKNFFAHPIIQLIGLQGVIVVITWIVTHLAKLPVWEIWLAILFGVGCTLWILNQFELWRNSKRQDFSRKSDAEIADILRKWFDKRHYSSRLVPDDKTLFHVVGTDTQNRRLNVFKPKENPSVICIRLSINEEQVARILPQPHQNAARFDISIEMARLGLLCHAGPPMYIDQELQCDEFLTESSFWNAIDKIRQGHVLIQAHLNLASIVAIIEKQNPSTTEQVPDKEGPQT